MSANESPHTTMKTTPVSEPRPALSKRHASPGLPRAPRLMTAGAEESESLGRLPGLVRALLGTSRGPSIPFFYKDNKPQFGTKTVSKKIQRREGEGGVRKSGKKTSNLTPPKIP